MPSSRSVDDVAPPAMTAAEIERYVDAAASALCLPLAPAHRTGVLRYFALAASMAGHVAAQPLSIDDEPAEVFVPVPPRPGHGE